MATGRDVVVIGYWLEKWPGLIEYGGSSQRLKEIPTAPNAQPN